MILPHNSNFVTHWEGVEPKLDELRTGIWAEMTGAVRRTVIDRFRTERPPTGLIELQRFYREIFGNQGYH